MTLLPWHYCWRDVRYSTEYFSLTVVFLSDLYTFLTSRHIASNRFRSLIHDNSKIILHSTSTTSSMFLVSTRLPSLVSRTLSLTLTRRRLDLRSIPPSPISIESPGSGLRARSSGSRNVSYTFERSLRSYLGYLALDSKRDLVDLRKSDTTLARGSDHTWATWVWTNGCLPLRPSTLRRNHPWSDLACILICWSRPCRSSI
jgi:hypothetical protein